MKKSLVVYFSASRETKQTAMQLANFIHADIEEIIPESQYTIADLNWRNKNSRSSQEMMNENSRPKLKKMQYNPQNYDLIFIGYPIWWGVEPRIIDTYIEQQDLSNKKIFLFATSGGSPIQQSIHHLQRKYPSLDIQDGILLNFGIDKRKIQEWIKE